jgi:hypothetical protein
MEQTMSKTSDVSAERVRDLFDYEADSGVFVRKIGIPGASKGPVAGCLRPDGYTQIGVDRKRVLTHRLVWLWVHGYFPDQIDHIDGDKTNNRLANLREATTSQNHGNMTKNVCNKSGFKGVRQRGKRWAASIKLKGVLRYIGTFATPEEAHAAYCEVAKQIHGEFFNPG